MNVKSNDLGDITLIKSDKTHIPIPSLTEIMKRRDAEKEKTSIDHSKVIKKIYQRNPNNPSSLIKLNKQCC